MDEKELLTIQKKIAEIVKGSAGNPQAAVAALMDIIKETECKAGNTSPAFYSVAATAHEASGDIYMKAKKIGEAEKAFLEMMKMSVKLYEQDKEKYDYRLAFSYYKRAAFYRTALQCNTLSAKPKELTPLQKKMFELTEGLYKNAVACTMDHARKGVFRYVELHALVMSELLILYAAIGDYEKAIICGKDGIKLDKAIYEKLDDKAHSFRLANRMNALATVYTFQKDIQNTMETFEDAIFVLKEHEAEDPITFGVMLARNYISLGSCYAVIKEEAHKAEKTYQQGLNRMVEVNQKAENRLINDVITSYMMVGDYYKRVKKEENAKLYYGWALKQATELYGKTKDARYENIMKRLLPLV